MFNSSENINQSKYANVKKYDHAPLIFDSAKGTELWYEFLGLHSCDIKAQCAAKAVTQRHSSFIASSCLTTIVGNYPLLTIIIGNH